MENRPVNYNFQIGLQIYVADKGFQNQTKYVFNGATIDIIDIWQSYNLQHEGSKARVLCKLQYYNIIYLYSRRIKIELNLTK